MKITEIKFTVDEFANGHRDSLMLALECYRRKVESYEVALENLKAITKTANDTVAALKLYNLITIEEAQEILETTSALDRLALISLNATKEARDN